MSLEGLTIGQTLSKEMDKISMIATVEADGIHFEGEIYTSLSGVAKAMLEKTGRKGEVNGWKFFGLVNPKEITRTRKDGSGPHKIAQPALILDPQAELAKIRAQAAAAEQALQERLTKQQEALITERAKVAAALAAKMEEAAKLEERLAVIDRILKTPCTAHNKIDCEAKKCQPVKAA